MQFKNADERAGAVKALRWFSEVDLHGLIPHSEIGNHWYHYGLDEAQRESARYAERIEEDDSIQDW